MPKTNIAGRQLEYVWYGPSPDKTPTIVFLHEGLGCVAMWRDFPEQVARATENGVLVYSRAGYGDSDSADLPRTVSFMHDEAVHVLPELLEAFGIQQTILFGHSDGGSIALIHAASSATANVSALILEAPHVFVENLSVESIIKAKENYENGTLKSSLERYHGRNVDCAFHGWNDTWLNPEFRSWNIESLLPSIKVPLLVIQGENDQYGTLEQVKAIRKGCLGSVETLILDNCGHSPHRDRPNEVLERTRSFLKSIG